MDFREGGLEMVVLGEVKSCIYSILSPRGVWVRVLLLSMLKHSPVWLDRLIPFLCDALGHKGGLW
jgi:hypothetical protein